MHLTNLCIFNLPPLREVKFDFDRHVNLFVGPNSSGKSTILRTIRDAKYMDEFYHEDFEPHADTTDVPTGPFPYPKTDFSSNWFPNEGGRHFYSGEFFDWFSPESLLSASNDWLDSISENPEKYRGTEYDEFAESVWNFVPCLFVPATRIGCSDSTIGYDYPDWIGNSPFGYREISFGNSVSYPFGYPEVFDGNFVTCWIDSRKGKVSTKEQEKIHNALVVAASCVKSICGEVIRDVDNSGFNAVLSYDPLGESLPASKLSSGVQGTLLWVQALALQMAADYEHADNWQNEPAILLIDEIENHLHPTWQRRVIRALLEHFPGLQIFATTHSPYVVAGLKAGQVHKLSRDSSGKVSVSTYDRDIVGWTSDDISREMLDILDPTDLETAGAAERLRELRAKGPSQDEQEEEDRQREMLNIRLDMGEELLDDEESTEIFDRLFAERFEYRFLQNLDQDSN